MLEKLGVDLMTSLASRTAHSRFLVLAGLAFSFLLHGCATNVGGYTSTNQLEDRLVGMSEEELAMALGAPTQRTTLRDNSEVWSYRTRTEGLRGGQCNVSVTMDEGYVVSSNINKRDRSPVAAPLGSCGALIGNLD